MKPMQIDRRHFTSAVTAGVAIGAFGGAASAADPSPPVARTRTGRVSGFRRNGAEIYLGIPYGASTAGERRFLPPAPPAAWSDVRQATTLGQRAPQAGPTLYESPLYGPFLTGGRAQLLIDMHEQIGEDCLALNVLTPRADKGGRPVLVQFHGGGYTTGSGAVNTLGDRLVTEEDVVLVTVNHRLGALGFLYLGSVSEQYAQGNPSLLDLVAALQWVRDNIENFGGDPSKVTIFGESGGGGKVGLIMAMPQARGLYHRAIMESSAFPAASPADEAIKSTNELMAKLSAKDVAALRAIPHADLVAAAGPGASGPMNDGHTLSGPLWSQGAPAGSADIPLIVGVCAHEESIFSAMRDRAIFQTDWTGVPTHLAGLTGIPAAKLEPCLAAYRSAYPSDGPVSIALRMLSVAGFGLGRYGRDIANRKAAQAAPVYYYRNEFDTRIAPGLGAFHTSDQPLACRMVLDPRSEALSKLMAGAWAAFARTGDPNHAGMPRWEAFHANSPGPMIVFNETSRSVSADPEYGAQAMLRTTLQQSAPPR